MPEWANTVWGKLIGLLATSIVSGLIAAGTTAVHFYYETQRDIAVLKAELAEVQRDLGIRIADNAVAVNRLQATSRVLDSRSRAHGTQIAQVVKTQSEINGVLTGDVAAPGEARNAKRYGSAPASQQIEAPVAPPPQPPEKPKG